MSARLNADGTATEIAGDIAPTPNPPAYAEAEAKPSTIIYKSHGGRPNHVPLCESSKNDLHRAVRDSDPAKLADLLADPAMLAKINDADMFGFRPLHLACQTTTTGPKLGAKDPDCIACAELLISAGADVNVQTTEDQWSQTPLMLAVSASGTTQSSSRSTASCSPSPRSILTWRSARCSWPSTSTSA